MHIILNNSSMTPIYEQLMTQIKGQIISGDITENQALPSVRALSAELKISALTVKKAYDKLEEEGFRLVDFRKIGKKEGEYLENYFDSGGERGI